MAAKVHTIEKRHDHTACACQTSSGGEIDAAATSRVAGFNMNRWVLGMFLLTLLNIYQVETYPK